MFLEDYGIAQYSLTGELLDLSGQRYGSFKAAAKAAERWNVGCTGWGRVGDETLLWEPVVISLKVIRKENQ